MMWTSKYGEFQDDQVSATKAHMRKQIYFLLLYVDANTRDQYKNVDVSSAFDNLLYWFGGLNEILNYPPKLIKVISLLEAAKLEYESENFKYSRYRKLILDAGNLVLEIEEV